jgi:hypothetical protein
MEDAAGVDLDWFWRGWFYTTEAVDVAIDNMTEANANTMNPEEQTREAAPLDITKERNKTAIPQTAIEANPALKDFYNNQTEEKGVSQAEKTMYQQYLKTLNEDEQKVVKAKKYYYQVDFVNKGGLVMPIIVEFEYEDGSKEVMRIPAEIWRMNNEKISKIFPTTKKVKAVSLDPYLETADIDESNNSFPKKPAPSKFELFKQKQPTPENPMQRKKREETSKQGLN